MNKGANRHGGGGPLIGYSSSQRRQIMASLRRCFRVLGLKRDNPGTGALGQGCVRLAGIALVVLSPTLYILAGASEALGQTIPRDGWNYQWSFTTMTADVAPIVTSTMQTTAPQQGSTSTTVQGANPNPTSQGSTLSAANPGNIILTINTDQSAPAGSNDVLTLQGTVNDPNEGTPRYRNFFTGYVDSTTSLTNVIIGDRWGDPNNLSKTIINGGILQFGNGASVNTGGAIGIGVASKSGAAPNASGGGRGVAIGTESNAMTTGGSSPVAIGWGANAQGGGSQIAIGDQSAATGFNSVALGGNAGAPATAATGSYALAIGPSTKATAENTVSMGRTAMASAADAIAIGGNATAGANASASGAVAIGAQTTASAANGVAIGNGASISSTGTDTNVAMGANSTADGSTLSASAYNPGSAILAGISPVGEVSIGSSRKERRMTNVAAGANATDAVNVSQLTSLDTKVDNQGNGIATVIGGGSSYDPAIGKLNTPTDIGGTGKDNINDAIAAANAAANTGWNLQANGDTASQVKPGDTVQFTDGHNIAITRNGEKLTVSTTPDLAADSLTAGNTKIDTNGLTIMGGPSVLASGIDAGGKKITDVAAGDLTATSADAVNGSQLFITNQTVTTVNNNLNTLGDNTATVIGGGSTYNPATGTLTTPTDIGGTGKDNINDAIAAANAAANTGWNLQANGDTASQVKPGDTVQFTDGHNIAITRNGEKLTVSTTPNLTADSLTAGNTKIDTNGLTIMGGPSVLASGIDAGGKKITDVAAGDLTATSADAVNGSQLFTTNEWLMTLGNQLNGAGGFGQTMQSVLGGNAHYDTTTGGMTMSNIGGTGKDNINDAIQAANTAASAGWNLQANGDTASQVKPGDTVQFTNGQNIAITRNGENLTIATAPDLTANSLTAGNTTINNSGLTIQNGPSVTSSGIDAGGQKVTNVADGTVAAGSKDAVNGGQLHNTANSVASALGGGSKVNSDGTVSAPSYTVQGNTYNNVGSALGAVDSNITNLGTTVNSIGGDVTALKNGTAGVVQRSGENGTVLTAPGGTGANPGAAQTLGNVADGEVNGTSKQAVNGSQLYDTNQQLADVEKTAGNSVQYDTNPNGTRANTVTLQGGDANAPVVLKNVGTGTDDTDAVNVKQLKDGNAQTLASANTYTDTKTEWAVDQSKAYTDTTAGNTLKSANAYTDQKFDALDQQMGNLSSQIGDVRKEARQAAAIGLAAASLRYDDRPGKLSAAISGGYWRDQGAFAFGVGYTSESGRLRANISGTTAGGHVGAGAGLSYTFN